MHQFLIATQKHKQPSIQKLATWTSSGKRSSATKNNVDFQKRRLFPLPPIPLKVFHGVDRSAFGFGAASQMCLMFLHGIGRPFHQVP